MSVLHWPTAGVVVEAEARQLVACCRLTARNPALQVLQQLIPSGALQRHTVGRASMRQTDMLVWGATQLGCKCAASFCKLDPIALQTEPFTSNPAIHMGVSACRHQHLPFLAGPCCNPKQTLPARAWAPPPAAAARPTWCPEWQSLPPLHWGSTREASSQSEQPASKLPVMPPGLVLAAPSPANPRRAGIAHLPLRGAPLRRSRSQWS